MSGERAAVVAARAGAERWRAAVVEQRSAPADHADFYALAGEITQTVRALDGLAGVLAPQVCGYGRGRVLRDDEGLRPAARLADAIVLLDRLRELLGEADAVVNEFWSAVGHISVEDGAR